MRCSAVDEEQILEDIGKALDKVRDKLFDASYIRKGDKVCLARENPCASDIIFGKVIDIDVFEGCKKICVDWSAYGFKVGAQFWYKHNL